MKTFAYSLFPETSLFPVRFHSDVLQRYCLTIVLENSHALGIGACATDQSQHQSELKQSRATPNLQHFIGVYSTTDSVFEPLDLSQLQS